MRFVESDDGENGQSEGQANSNNYAKDISAPSLIVFDGKILKGIVSVKFGGLRVSEV